MKKILVLLSIVLISTSVLAKKVKFAVDMTDQTVSPNGVHISGDFQTIAGFSGGDWNSATCAMLQEGVTEIYSIVVEIPAFHKYEYRIINGDLFYESEFVPVESRVGYDFNDNRWIYVDSLANDTSFAGAVLFGGNAPEGLKLVRFLVDMSQQTVSQAGVYVAGSYNGWNYTSAPLYNFEGTIYETIQYMPQGAFEYKFANGYNNSNSEYVPINCATNDNRSILVDNDTLTEAVCFASCFPCGTGINTPKVENINIFPNPSNGNLFVNLNEAYQQIVINDMKGCIIFTAENVSVVKLNLNNINSGTYFINCIDRNNRPATFKFIVQK